MKNILKIFICLFGVVILTGCGNDIEVVKNTTLEINDDISISSLIKAKDNITISNKDEKVNTTSLGKKKVTIKYYFNNDKNKTIKKYDFEVEIKDTKKPDITCEDVITTYVGQNFKIEDYAKVNDNSKETIVPVIDGDYDVTKEGEYKVKLTATDSSSNKIEKEITIKVLDPKVKNEGFYVYKAQEEWLGIIFKADSTVVLNVHPCPGYACGMYSLQGTYTKENNKLKVIYTHESEIEPNVPLKEAKTVIYEVVDENTIKNEGNEYKYQPELW